jgi:hypothetical protein
MQSGLLLRQAVRIVAARLQRERQRTGSLLPAQGHRLRGSDERLQEIERRINSRPRKTLGWRAPYEVFAEALKKRVAIRS